MLAARFARVATSIDSTDAAQARIHQEKKLRMQTSPQITDPISDSGSASVSSAPAETALFDLPDATPWTHLIAAWLFWSSGSCGLGRLHHAFRRY
jgi:hypothetical protein